MLSRAPNFNKFKFTYWKTSSNSYFEKFMSHDIIVAKQKNRRSHEVISNKHLNITNMELSKFQVNSFKTILYSQIILKTIF